MSDEAAFLRAIQADPADATAKLVYADWLDERGEREKAEYLRLSSRPGSAKRLSDAEHRRLYELQQRHFVWLELLHRTTPVWDTLTMYTLGQLEGLLRGYAALNGHRSDIGYDFHAVLRPHSATLAETVESHYTGCAPVTLEPLANWEVPLGQILNEWLFHELRHIPTPPHAILALFDADGRRWMVDGVLGHVRAVINPTAGWRVRVTPNGFYALDWADVALEAEDRVLFLHFSFSD